MRRKLSCLLAIVTVLTMSACGPGPSAQKAETGTTWLQDGADKEEAGSGAGQLEMELSTQEVEELLAAYDFDRAMRLDALELDLDDYQIGYTYLTLRDGKYTEQVWEVDGDDPALLLDPPGERNTYNVKYYDRNGYDVVSIAKRSDGTSTYIENISVFERDEDGKLEAQYLYLCTEPGGDYILSTANLYDKGKLVCSVDFDMNTHTKSRVCVNSADGNGLTAMTLLCDSEGNFTFYDVYEYDQDQHMIRDEEYDMNHCLVYAISYRYNDNGDEIWEGSYGADGQLESYTTTEYDEAGHILKRANYDSNETLRDYRVYTWTDDFAACTYETFDAQGNVTSSGRYT